MCECALLRGCPSPHEAAGGIRSPTATYRCANSVLPNVLSPRPQIEHGDPPLPARLRGPLCPQELMKLAAALGLVPGRHHRPNWVFPRRRPEPPGARPSGTPGSSDGPPLCPGLCSCVLTSCPRLLSGLGFPCRHLLGLGVGVPPEPVQKWLPRFFLSCTFFLPTPSPPLQPTPQGPAFARGGGRRTVPARRECQGNTRYISSTSILQLFQCT